MSFENFWVELVGFGGTAFTIASYSMRTIIPLRVVGILSSVFFIAYAVLIGSAPMLVTELVILPLNTIRLVQILRLNREVERAAASDLSFEWLEPYGHGQEHAAGDVVFRAGDPADHLLMISSGRFRLVEAGIELEAGKMVGELGFLSPGNARTMTLECIAAGATTRVSYSDIKQLYFQNPRFGFSFLRLVSERLFQNIDRARAAGMMQAPGETPTPVAAR